MKTGNTSIIGYARVSTVDASMEPGHEDREYTAPRNILAGCYHASMEPGHEDREYRLTYVHTYVAPPPQWSPVMKTGNT